MPFRSKNTAPVLLVEDDENDAFFFQRAYAKTGLANQLQVAEDGIHAIEQLAAASHGSEGAGQALPCLIVLDLNMPRRNGFEVMAWIRDNLSVKPVIVVFTSSFSDADVAKCYELGANSYVVKPTGGQDVIQLVEQMLNYWVSVNRTLTRGSTHAAPTPGGDDSR